MATDSMLAVSNSVQLCLGRPAINQPSTCRGFYLSKCTGTSCLTLLLKDVVSCRVKSGKAQNKHNETSEKNKNVVFLNYSSEYLVGNMGLKCTTLQ